MHCSANELIDTLWNVNFVLEERLQIQTNELIDTLWNVNKFTICCIGTG